MKVVAFPHMCHDLDLDPKPQNLKLPTPKPKDPKHTSHLFFIRAGLVCRSVYFSTPTSKLQALRPCISGLLVFYHAQAMFAIPKPQPVRAR